VQFKQKIYPWLSLSQYVIVIVMVQNTDRNVFHKYDLSHDHC